MTAQNDWIEPLNRVLIAEALRNAYPSASAHAIEFALKVYEAEVRSQILTKVLGECECDTSPNSDGPEETCPQHGRTIKDWMAREQEALRRVHSVSDLITRAATGGSLMVPVQIVKEALK